MESLLVKNHSHCILIDSELGRVLLLRPQEHRFYISYGNVYCSLKDVIDFDCCSDDIFITSLSLSKDYYFMLGNFTFRSWRVEVIDDEYRLVLYFWFHEDGHGCRSFVGVFGNIKA